jgi:hypothetical protein
MLPADMGEQLMTETLRLPLPVRGPHKRREGRTVIPFTEGYYAPHMLLLARGHRPRQVRIAVRRDDGCTDERPACCAQSVLTGRPPRAVSIADSHAQADQPGAHDVGELRHDLFMRMRRRGHAADLSPAQLDHTHGLVRHPPTQRPEGRCKAIRAEHCVRWVRRDARYDIGRSRAGPLRRRPPARSECEPASPPRRAGWRDPLP